MKLNRTYLQKKLKNNPFVVCLYVTKVYKLAKKFLSDKSQWKSIQESNLMDILDYANKHSKYYHAIACGLKHGNISKHLEVRSYPLLDKHIILREGRNIYSDEITDDWKIWLNTGGSTGEPLHFPALYHGMPWEAIAQMMMYITMGYRKGDTIVGVTGHRVPEADLERHIYWDKGNGFPWGKLYLSTLYLNEDTFMYYWNELEGVKPKILRGYPSGILEICKFAKKNGLTPSFKLKGVYLTSENFTQDEKGFVAAFFKCPVYGQYGHTESSVFAMQLPDSEEYLTNPLYGYTEVLDKDGNQVAIGETGEVVVTGFIEHGLPFIRYKTGDLAVYGGETEYGETRLTKLCGRDVDFIYNKQKEKVFLVGFIFGGHIKAFNHIISWQIQQREVGKVDVFIVKGEGYTKQTESDVKSLFENHGFDISMNYVDRIEKTQRGKQKFLIQMMSLSDLSL